MAEKIENGRKSSLRSHLAAYILKEIFKIFPHLIITLTTQIDDYENGDFKIKLDRVDFFIQGGRYQYVSTIINFMESYKSYDYNPMDPSYLFDKICHEVEQAKRFLKHEVCLFLFLPMNFFG